MNNPLTKQAIIQKAWESLISDTKKWLEVNIDSSGDIYEFTNVYQKVLDKEPLGNVSY